jgi:hypothetical protein
VIFLTQIVIFNFNINVFFNYYDFIGTIICNVGSQSEHTTNVLHVDMLLSFLAVCLV